MSYEAGFDQGERDAFADRKAGIPLDREFKAPLSPFDRGYRDGYTPRSPGWWYGLPQTAERQAA
jgi:hypothetical protein